MLAKKINYGCTIGVVAPSNSLEGEKLKYFLEAERFFIGKGFHIKRGKHIFESWYGSGGTPVNRANDLNDMFLDNEVDIIMCIEGGDTCNTILPYLKFEEIKRHPKILIGYSDITVLLQTIYEKTGMITFHGAEFYEYGILEFQERLYQNFVNRLINRSSKIQIDSNASVVREGKASGKSMGTNLSCTMNLLGTEYFPNFQDTIFFMESYKIEPNECARRCWQLKMNGFFDRINGLVIGYIDAFQKENFEDATFQDILLEVVKDKNFPILKCNIFGHKIVNEIIPIGVRMSIDSDDKLITICEEFLEK